jgi:glycosyltransferase involved in cell wall biosynthesis
MMQQLSGLKKQKDKNTLSVYIITYNEQENIRDCLESVKWADEIIVVDSFSDDKTVEIVRNYTDKVFQRRWDNIVNQRNFALSLATGDWVFCLDADERLTDNLKEEILGEISKENACSGYYVKRHTKYLGKWINHCGWYPDYKLRLIRRGRGYHVGHGPHERIVVPDGNCGYLKGKILHYTYKNFSHQIKTIDRFSDEESKQMKKPRWYPLWFCLFFRPLLKFIEVYFLKLGFLDGVQGFIISVASAFYVFSKYVKLWEKRV